MISYAQNAEDVVLARLFAGRTTGRYVDVGAGDPVEASVTKHFYDLGWRGVNVEPIAAKADELRRARPGDVTLAVAVGAKPGEVVLHEVADGWGWSTTDDELARCYRAENGWQITDVLVEQVTLAELLDANPGAVDFLKIDVEGGEADVIQGADWTRHRPRVLVVEATEPGSRTQAHGAWEPVLLDAGYRCALFDGLNRFYAQADDDEAMTVLAAPANVFDDYERHGNVRLRQALASAETNRAAELGYIRRLEARLRDVQQAQERDSTYIRTLEAAVETVRRDLTKANRYSAALERRVAELEEKRGIGG